ITCESENTCDEIETRLKSSITNPLNESELERLLHSYKDSLTTLGFIVPEGLGKLHLITGTFEKETDQTASVTIVHSGDRLAEILINLLNDLEINVKELNVEELRKIKELKDEMLVIAAFDYWRPSVLRELNKHILQTDKNLLPIFLLPDSAVIGPLISRGYPCYLCFEKQLLTSLTGYIALRVIRDNAIMSEQDLSKLKGYAQMYPLAYFNFVAGMASLLVAHTVAGNDYTLRSKAIIIDLRRLYIDVVRVHRLPTCICVNVKPRAEL
ncbi:MAG: hypothetical protein GXO23_02040, partial [Crenarchaeota archaeon]|nr:hypothetical protein [Thermoproteota archaeon]